jgi:predicted permease
VDWSDVRDAFRVTRFRPDARSDVDEELAFHFDELVRRLVEQGMAPEEARREARRRFGDEPRYRSELEAMEPPHVVWYRRMRDGLGGAIAALTLAVRGLTRSPGLCFAVVGTLALGVGANVAMFRVADRLLLSPPEHVAHADRVRTLHFAGSTDAGREMRSSWSHPDFQDLQSVDAFAAVAAYAGRTLVVGEGAAAEPMSVKAGSGEIFSVLGIGAAHGRLFGPEAEPVTVLSWELWDRAYGRDPDVLGTTLQVGAGRYTVLGVTPRGFTGADLAPVDLWLPLEHFGAAEEIWPWRTSRGFRWIRLVARLAPGVSESVALEQATAAYRAAPDASTSRNESMVVAATLVPAERPDAGGEVRVARWLGAVSFLVLLIACANVANLLLTRNLRRRRELAVRAALGIGRRRLVAQLITEAGLLALAGGAAGLAVAGWVGSTTYGVLLPDVVISEPFLDARVLLFTTVAVALTGVLGSVLPAVQASGSDLLEAIKSGGERASSSRTHTQVGLLVFQITLSVVLLTGATVFVRSLTNLGAVDLGFDTEDLMLVGLAVDGAPAGLMGDSDGGEPSWPPNEVARIYELAEERLATLPGLVGAAMMNPTPFRFALSQYFAVPRLDSLPRASADGPYVLAVTPDYFAVVGLDVVAGRGIEAGDDRFGAQPVVVLNETMTGLLWPGESPLGRCVVTPYEDGPCTTVVGVVEDSHFQAIVEPEAQMLYYVPLRQQVLAGAPTSIFVRAEGADVASIQAAAMSASPRVRYAYVETWSDLTAFELRPWTLGAVVFSAFGVLALLVAALGLYAVFAFDVAGRSRELGVRSALGATRLGLFGLVMRDVGLLSLAGVGLGFLLVAGARRWIDPLLYETSATEFGTLVPVGVLLVGVTLLAAAVPGRRASQADPVEVLRAD